MLESILILGGTNFIGRAFCEHLLKTSQHQVTILNRGITNPELFPSLKRLKCDRSDAAACIRSLAGTHWNHIVDFSGYTHEHIENIVANCRFDHYTYLSSSAVELSWPDDELFEMAKTKLWCEHVLQNASDQVLIVRAGYVVGKYDYTERFEHRGGVWVWKGTGDPVQPVVDLSLLVSLLTQLIFIGHVGVVRAGYSQPRIMQPIAN
jgi:2'-hydroxyisoflavone reductase